MAGRASPHGCSSRRDAAASTPVDRRVRRLRRRPRSADRVAGWSCAGFPHLVMDSRGQGGGWRGADTPDVGATGDPGARGFLTSGLDGPGRTTTRGCSSMRRVRCRCRRRCRSWSGRQGRRNRSEPGRRAGAGRRQPRRTRRRRRHRCSVPVLTFAAPSRSPTARRTSRSATTAGCTRRVEQVFATLSYFDVVNHARRLRGAGVVQRRPGRPHHAAVDGVLGVQPLCRREGDRGVRVQRSRRRGDVHFERKVAFVRALAE